MIKGTEPVRGSYQRELIALFGKWNGSAAPANGVYPALARSDGRPLCKGLTLTRTGTGLYTLGFSDGNVPVVLNTDVTIVSATALYTVQFLTEAANPLAVTIKIAVAGAPTDPVAADIIEVVMFVANTGTP